MSLVNTAADSVAVGGKPGSGLAVQSAWVSVVLPAAFLWLVFAWMNGPAGFERLLDVPLLHLFEPAEHVVDRPGQAADLILTIESNAARRFRTPLDLR